MEKTQTLGQVIRSRRQELGLTQEQLAERIGGGVRQAEVSRLESDRVVLPRRQRLERIAAALQIPLGTLLARAGWSGADHAFVSAEPNDMAPQVDAHEAERPSTEGVQLQRHSSLTPPHDIVRQLRDAVEQSQEIQLRTAHLLKTSRELAVLWADGGR